MMKNNYVPTLINDDVDDSLMHLCSGVIVCALYVCVCANRQRCTRRQMPLMRALADICRRCALHQQELNMYTC